MRFERITIDPQVATGKDQGAVACAKARGLAVVRTPTLYVAAKRRGLIVAVRPKLDLLRSVGFRLKDRDYEAVLRVAGERLNQ